MLDESSSENNYLEVNPKQYYSTILFFFFLIKKKLFQKWIFWAIWWSNSYSQIWLHSNSSNLGNTHIALQSECPNHCACNRQSAFMVLCSPCLFSNWRKSYVMQSPLSHRLVSVVLYVHVVFWVLTFLTVMNINFDSCACRKIQDICKEAR